MQPNTPQAYYDAASERFNDARYLFDNRRYVAASYLAGCAIEAVFWAFIPEHQQMGHRGRHDLQKLYEAGLGQRFDALFRNSFRSGLVVSKKSEDFAALSRQISENLTNARLRWDNSFRYYPEPVLRTFVQRSSVLRSSGDSDLVRGSTDVLVKACQFFITLAMQKRGWIL